jgi:CBS domain-containing protein
MAPKIVPDVLRNNKIVHLSGKASVREAAYLMRKHDIGAVLVMEKGDLTGIFTVADMTYRVIADSRDPDTTHLKDVMTARPDTIAPDSAAIDALRLMQDGGYRHLPVVESGTVIGMVSRRDFHGTEKARLDEETRLWERIG